MIPDPYAKTISLPVRIRNGKPEFFHAEGPLPKLKEGTIADLIVPAFAVEDKEVRAALLQKGREKLLAGGTTVLAVVSNPDATDALVRLDAYESDGNMLLGAKIVLLDDLHLHLEATKRPFLAPVDCHVPALRTHARSLNEAYTLISTKYESWRRSHSFNAFRKILWRDQRGTRPRWRLWMTCAWRSKHNSSARFSVNGLRQHLRSRSGYSATTDVLGRTALPVSQLSVLP